VKGQGHGVIRFQLCMCVYIVNSRQVRRGRACPYNCLFFSVSLSISIASRALMFRTCHLAHLSVCVCLESVLWQNGWLEPDTVWGGECGRVWYGCILDGVGDCRKGRGSFGVNLGVPL